MKLRVMLMGLGLSLAGMAFAEISDDKEALIRQSLQKSLPNMEVVSVAPVGVPGLYEVRSNYRETLYVTEDGKHLLVGDLFRLSPVGLQNLTEAGREKERLVALSAIPEADMVVFKPKQTKAKITVFTDVDCGYCRKLHQDVPKMNELGIQVNYVGYPRAGVGSSSHQKLVSVWCAPDRQKAMTAAKQGRDVESATCANPVAAQYAVGNALHISGTPAIILENGALIPGYVEPEVLASQLGELGLLN